MDAWKLACTFRNVLPPEAFEEVLPEEDPPSVASLLPSSIRSRSHQCLEAFLLCSSSRFLRTAPQGKGFRAVRFTLHTSDLLSTVLYILNSCSLSAEHIQSLNTNVHSQPLKETAGMPDRPIKWHRSYYSFTGFKDPDEDLEHVSRVETTLLSWLGSNGESAVKKLKDSLPLRKELDRLKNELSELLQLSDIRWQRGWGVAHRCSQLHSLSRLAQQNLEPLQNAKGCTIVFTDRSGMSALGHVMLGTMDVHHHWTRLFESLPSYFDLQRKMSALENQISSLLGGIQVVYIEELQPAFTIDEYYSLLDVFYNQLLRALSALPQDHL